MILTSKPQHIHDALQRKPSGSPLMTIQINLDEVRKSGGVSLSADLRAVAVKLGSPQAASILRSLADSIDGPTDTSRLERANSCQEVVWGCGSCGTGSLVEVFCDGGGSGSEPDYTYCIDCE